MVAQGGDLLLSLGFGHRPADTKLRTGHFGLEERLHGGFCFQTCRSLLPPAQCANSVQKHMSLLSDPHLWSLSCLLRSQRCRHDHVALGLCTLHQRLISGLFLGSSPKPVGVTEHNSSGVAGIRSGFVELRRVRGKAQDICFWSGMNSPEQGLCSKGHQRQSQVHLVSTEVSKLNICVVRPAG